MSVEDFIDLLFDTLRECIESITLPTGSNLIPSFLYSLLMFVASGVCALMDWPSFVRWQGALIATLLLLGLAIIERRGEDEISRLYRAVKSGASAVKKRAKRPSSSVEAVRGADVGDAMSEPDSGRSDGIDEM